MVNPDNKYRWLLIAFAVKIIFFIYFYPREIADPETIGLRGGDTDSYFSPVENLLSKGTYSPDYRMPGYGWIYLLLRTFFPKSAACNIIIITQWLLSSLSVYYLARCTFILTGSRPLFVWVFFTFLLSTATNTLDYYLLTESFTSSALIFCFYFFAKYWYEKKERYLVFSGAMLCWAIFMRPIMLVLLVLFSIVIIILGLKKRYSLKTIFFAGCLFCLTSIICDAAWIMRNLLEHKRFIPLTTTKYPLDLQNTYYNELMEFVIAWGGDRTWWNQDAEIRWFINNENSFGRYTKDLPDYIYTSAFNRDSLENVKKLMNKYELATTDSITRKNISLTIRKSLSQYTSSIKEEKPFLFYIKSRVLMLKKFLVHSGTPLLFNEKFSDLSVFNKVLKVTYSIVYILVTSLGILGAFLCFRYSRTLLFLLFPAVSLYLILIYPLLGHFEYRYLVPTYPFLLVCACQLILRTQRQLAVAVNVR